MLRYGHLCYVYTILEVYAWVHYIAIGVPEPQPSGSKDNSGVKGKRKRSREDRVEAVMASVVKEVVNAQKESDKLFLEVEEKMMKFEAELKREERVFQLR